MRKIQCIHCGEENSCDGHITGILTDPEIKKYSLIKKEDLWDRSLQGTSYDLRLGEGHLVYKTDPTTKQNQWLPYWIGDPTEIDKLNKVEPHFKPQGELLKIGPFGAALIQLKETIDTRTCCKDHNTLICGHFDLKLKMVIKGIVSQQATQVEPNYTGKLFCYIFNQTGTPIELKYKERIATLEFFYVSCSTFCNVLERESLLSSFDKYHKDRYQEENGGLKTKVFCNEHGIDDVRFFWREKDDNYRLPDHGGLNSFYEEFKNLEGNVRKKVEELDTNKLIQGVKKSISEDINSLKATLRWEANLKAAVIALIITLVGLLLGTGVFVQIYQGKMRQFNTIFEQKREESKKFFNEQLEQNKAEMEKLKNTLELEIINNSKNIKEERVNQNEKK